MIHIDNSWQIFGREQMPKKAKYLIQLQKTNGGSPTVSFEITESKFQSVLRLLQPEINKRRMKSEQATSISLMDFF